jgi:hypothetical protein
MLINHINHTSGILTCNMRTYLLAFTYDLSVEDPKTSSVFSGHDNNLMLMQVNPIVVYLSYIYTSPVVAGLWLPTA